MGADVDLLLLATDPERHALGAGSRGIDRCFGMLGRKGAAKPGTGRPRGQTREADLLVKYRRDGEYGPALPAASAARASAYPELFADASA